MGGKSIARRACLIGSLVGATLMSAGITPTFAQTEPIQSQDTNIGGVVAEITQMKREDGVLTVKKRLRNLTDKKVEVRLTVGHPTYHTYYLTAGNKKYFILCDSENVPLSDLGDSGGTA